MNDGRRLRVVLVDDHALVRSGLRAELGDGVDVVGEAADVDEAVRVVTAQQPDVVLLDVHLPGGDGRAVLDACAESAPATRFLAISVSDAPADVVSVVRGGARGYVTKAISGEDLRAGVDAGLVRSPWARHSDRVYPECAGHGCRRRGIDQTPGGDRRMTRPAAFAAPRDGVEMTPCRYCVLENVADGVVPDEREHVFHASPEGFVIGLWSCSPCTERMPSYPNDEFCVVTQGRVVLTGDDGVVSEHGEGDAFVMQQGWSGTWAMPEPFTKYFVLGPVHAGRDDADG